MRVATLSLGFVPAMILLTFLGGVVAHHGLHVQDADGIYVDHEGHKLEARNRELGYNEPADDYGYPPPYGPVPTSSDPDPCKCYMICLCLDDRAFG